MKYINGMRADSLKLQYRIYLSLSWRFAFQYLITDDIRATLRVKAPLKTPEQINEVKTVLPNTDKSAFFTKLHLHPSCIFGRTNKRRLTKIVTFTVYDIRNKYLHSFSLCCIIGRGNCCFKYMLYYSMHINIWYIYISI